MGGLRGEDRGARERVKEEEGGEKSLSV